MHVSSGVTGQGSWAAMAAAAACNLAPGVLGLILAAKSGLLWSLICGCYNCVNHMFVVAAFGCLGKVCVKWDDSEGCTCTVHESLAFTLAAYSNSFGGLWAPCCLWTLTIGVPVLGHHECQMFRTLSGGHSVPFRVGHLRRLCFADLGF